MEPLHWLFCARSILLLYGFFMNVWLFFLSSGSVCHVLLVSRPTVYFQLRPDLCRGCVMLGCSRMVVQAGLRCYVRPAAGGLCPSLWADDLGAACRPVSASRLCSALLIWRLRGDHMSHRGSRPRFCWLAELESHCISAAQNRKNI